MLTLSTIILGTTMTVGDGLLSLGISMAANKISDKLKEWLTPVEEDALYFAYENALERWCKNAGGREFMRYRLKDLKGLFLDYLKGDISSASTEIQELMGVWYEEIVKSEDCRNYLESGRFKTLFQEISATSLIAKANGEKLDALSSQLADVDEHIIDEIKALKDVINKQLAIIRNDYTAISQQFIGVTSHSDVTGYLPRFCHPIDDTPGLNLFLGNQIKRFTLLECVMGIEKAPENNHYVLYGSAQVGKSTELHKLAFDLQQSNLYLPILIESKYYPNLAIGDLPEIERKGGKTIALLIDALDESADYDAIRIQIEGYSKLHPSMIIAVSCRSNYRTLAKMHGFKELVLEDMLWQDVIEYINNNATTPKQLITSIDESKLHPLLTTPFIVKNVVDIFNRKGQLPKDKNEFYENFITLAYEKASEKLNPAISKSHQSIIDYHIRVAIVMQLTKRQYLTKDELLLVAEKDDTLVNNSLRVNLMEKEGDTYGFIHNAFREYFCARFFMQKTNLAEVQTVVCYKNTTEIKQDRLRLACKAV